MIPVSDQIIVNDGQDTKMRLEEDLVIRRSRPTMISAKYRAREERRRLLKISAGKLRKIEDPETSLCRSVLINNAVRRLQRENERRNYNALPVVAAYMDDTEDTSSRKRLADDTRNDEPSQKRQRHDDLDDMFSDFYILPPTPRLLSHIDEMHSEPTASHHGTLHLSFPEDRLSDVRSDSAVSANTTSNTGTSNGVNDTSCHSVLFPGDLDDANLSRPVTDMMEVDPDRLCDFTRFADSRTLEERLVELQSLDEHFDLTKFERNNNQSCGRAIHDIQTFHSLVPGLET
ncbi:uncharacterized protein LOC109858798 isoform X2 [Pseudomyrmex gracilis]|uniref:uncharacterized protein LOC109858798 isoform X2 n=1 Tax=Pseudomyrmex gracilis TaxID=219809 RepID=UPI000994FC0F|nr:uncharacterized protein LOC109858798 isoform X2 [Pseudomyrmex gracilis]